MGIYFIAYLTGDGSSAATDGYFTEYITREVQPVVLMIIFLLVVAFIIFRGVNKGIESFSKVLMPTLLLLVVGISIFSVTIDYTDASGVTRTGLDGFKIYVIPDLKGLTVKGFFTILVDAMGQNFNKKDIALFWKAISFCLKLFVFNHSNLDHFIRNI